MSDYFACLDLINLRMSSALLALSPAGAAIAGAASGCGAGADSVTAGLTSEFGTSDVLSVATGLSAVGTDTCELPW